VRWLADECVSARLVARLRESGADVLYVTEFAPGTHDREIVGRASSGDRLLLTDDKDFGELIVRQRLPVPGIVLMRIGNDNYRQAWRRLEAAISTFGGNLFGRYTVIEQERFRSRKLRAGND
jgi:predicted nuclease of predicted toxin-antitoxin system